MRKIQKCHANEWISWECINMSILIEMSILTSEYRYMNTSVSIQIYQYYSTFEHNMRTGPLAQDWEKATVSLLFVALVGLTNRNRCLSTIT